MQEKLSHEAKVAKLTGESLPKQEIKQENKEKKILCLIGTAGSRHLAPWDDPRCEFWGVAHCLLLSDIPKLDKVFEIHLPYIYEKEPSPFSQKPIIYHANKEYALFNREKKDITVVCQKEDPNLNKVEILPRDELKKKYSSILPVSDAFYATNSIAWMILMGMELGYDEIKLFGIHLETDSEWQFERPCNEWWLGVYAGYQLAKGKKGVIYMPEQSDILRGHHEYGYADIEVRRKKIQGKIEFFARSIDDMARQRLLLIDMLEKSKREKEIPIEEKIKWFKDQIKLFTQEIEAYEKTDKEKFVNDLNTKIDLKMSQLNKDILTLDARMSSFRGAQETHQYYLKELSA